MHIEILYIRDTLWRVPNLLNEKEGFINSLFCFNYFLSLNLQVLMNSCIASFVVLRMHKMIRAPWCFEGQKQTVAQGAFDHHWIINEFSSSSVSVSVSLSLCLVCPDTHTHTHTHTHSHMRGSRVTWEGLTCYKQYLLCWVEFSWVKHRPDSIQST